MKQVSLQEELKLIENAKSNIQAFDKLYEMYLPQIYFYIKRRIIEVEVAEDLTSEVFLGAVEGVHKFDTGRNIRFSSWLYRTAHNKIVDYFRRNSKKLAFNQDISELKSDSRSQEEEYSHLEKQKAIAFVLSQLKNDYQQIITLKFFAELEIEEICQVMKIKPNNASVKLHRALQSFKKKYEKKFSKSVIFSIK